MLNEAELNKKEKSIDLLLDKSSDEIVDGLLNKLVCKPDDALNILKKYIQDGYTDKNKEILKAKQTLENIIEANKNVSKTRGMMKKVLADCNCGNKLFAMNEKNVSDEENSKLSKDQKIDILINSHIPPSVLLNQRSLVFKTTLSRSQEQLDRLKKDLNNPFLRKSDRDSKLKELQDIKLNVGNFYYFRVSDVKPNQIFTRNYYKDKDANPKEQVFTVKEFLDIFNDPVNSEAREDSYKYFPEGEEDSWKDILYSNFKKVKQNFWTWLDQAKDKFDLTQYSKKELEFLFRLNVVYDHNLAQAIDFLKSKSIQSNLVNKSQRSELKIPTNSPSDSSFLDDEDWKAVQSYLNGGKKESALDEAGYEKPKKDEEYYLTSKADIKNIEKIRDYLGKIGIPDDYIDMPFILKKPESNNRWAKFTPKNVYLPTEHRYVIIGVPKDPNNDKIKVKEVTPTGMKGEINYISADKIREEAIPANKITMIDPRNGEVLDLPLNHKLKSFTYRHGAKGTMFPISDENVERLLGIAQKLKKSDSTPLYAFDLISSYTYGRDSDDIKSAVYNVIDLLNIKQRVEAKTVNRRLKFYYTLGSSSQHFDPVAAMVSRARRKEGHF